MKVSPQLQQVIEAIAAAHGLNLYQPGEWLKLELPGFMPLTIEALAPGHISVAHYYRQNGDLIADPDVELYVTAEGWAPVAIQQPLGYGCYARIEAGQVTMLDAGRQRDLASFCDFWARNLAAQGWLTRATRHGGETDPAIAVAAA